MPRAQKVSLECVGQVADRRCKTSTVKFTIDPTPEGGLLKSAARQAPVGILVTPDDHKEVKPISLFGVLKGCAIEFGAVQVAPDRLADLEFLIREKAATCTIRLEGEWAELFADADAA